MRLVFIGGVGGSGTRVIANAFRHNGVFIGSHLNHSLDNLDWPGNIALMLDPDLSFEEKAAQLCEPFTRFIEQMTQQAQAAEVNQDLLAIKVPGSFHYLPYLCTLFDHVSYVHVVRHGLDMAFSSNKNQLRNWGSLYGLNADGSSMEAMQLKYWLAANRSAAHLERLPGLETFVQVQFERFCQQPKDETQRIFSALNMELNIGDVFFSNISAPESTGRYRQHDLTVFDSQDIAALEELGYAL